MPEFPKAMIEEFMASVNTTTKFTTEKIKPCRLKIDGEYLIMKSGKSLWNWPGAAKLALRYDTSYIVDSLVTKYLGDELISEKQLVNEFYEYLWNNVVEIELV